MKQLHALTEPYFCIMLKIEPFSPIFPLTDSMKDAFIGYSFVISRNKASTVFYGTAKKICRGMKMRSPMCLGKGKRFSIRWGSDTEAFFRYPGAAHRVERVCSGKAALESSKYGRGCREAL